MSQTLPNPRTRRYLSLDHWRGLACLVVLVNHSVWRGPDAEAWSSVEHLIVAAAERLWLGVPMFFVVSGYCISATVDAHRRRSERRLISYLARRVRRIFPPYWIVLAATVLYVAIIDIVVPGYPLTVGSGEFLRPWWYSAAQWAGNITLTEHWRTNVFGGQKAWFLAHAWTLGYEEQFYLVAAMLLWLKPNRFFSGAACISAAVAAIALVSRAQGWAVEGFFFDGSWLQFYVGVVAYHAINYGRPLARAMLVVALLAIACAILLMSDTLLAQKSESQAYLVALVFGALLIPAHRFDDRIANLGALRPLHHAGVMCYSLYLVHLPINKLVHVFLEGIQFPSTPWLTIPVCAAASISVAWWFHVNVERHFMSPSSMIQTRPAGMAVA
jgi:peptidoglycan/LPS O-acetylase OafA/YrhL